MAGRDASTFLPDAIEANRAGRLTDAQRAAWSGTDRSWRKNELVGSGVLVVAGIVLLVAPGPASAAVVKPLVGIACLVAAVVFLVRALPGVDALGNDLREGEVRQLDGAVSRRIIQVRAERGSGATFVVTVAGQTFDVTRDVYDAVPDGGILRAYFLPRSKQLVNFERLPDRPLPPEATASPGPFMAGVMAGMRSPDQVEQAEAKATMAAIHARAQTWSKGAPERPAAADVQPLGESIVGSWHAGPIAWAFAADGTATATLPNGTSRQGHWSVRPDGRLDLTGLGSEQAVEAWVAGDTLTVVMDGRSLALQRAG